MDKKYIILILVALAVIGLAAIFIYFNVLEKEPKEIGEREQEEVIPRYEISPEVSLALANRASMRMVDGALFDVGDNYFIIENATPVGDFMFDLENAQYEYEYKKIKLADESEIVDLSDVKHLTIPNDISGTLGALNYLKGKLNDYNVIIYAGYAVNQPKIEDYFPIPENCSGPFLLLEECQEYFDEYMPQFNALNLPKVSLDPSEINHEEDVATYIEWSAWPKN